MIILVLFSAIAAFVLRSFFDTLTGGANRLMAEDRDDFADTTDLAVIQKIFPEAQRTAEIVADTAWFAIAGGDTLGLVFEGFGLGFIDTIKFVAGLDREGNPAGLAILASRETKTIGERIRDPEFLEQFKSGEVAAISGATVSSRALIRAFEETAGRFRPFLKPGGR